jgi:hypothetical protein
MVISAQVTVVAVKLDIPQITHVFSLFPDDDNNRYG